MNVREPDPESLTLTQWLTLAQATPKPEPVDPPPAVAVALPVLAARPAWQSHANCRGVNPDLFFGRRGDSTVAAKLVCAACHVRADCLEYAVTHFERVGIWGGKSERERRRIRSARLHADQVVAS